MVRAYTWLEVLKMLLYAQREKNLPIYFVNEQTTRRELWLFAMATLQRKHRNGNIGLCCDDGLGVFHGQSGSEADRIRKDIVAHFKTLGLNVTISCNLKSVNFIDLTLRLDTGKHYPYRKPNDTPLYIHRWSGETQSSRKLLCQTRLPFLGIYIIILLDNRLPYTCMLMRYIHSPQTQTVVSDELGSPAGGHAR